jgi:hypothetical protein
VYLAVVPGGEGRVVVVKTFDPKDVYKGGGWLMEQVGGAEGARR